MKKFFKECAKLFVIDENAAYLLAIHSFNNNARF